MILQSLKAKAAGKAPENDGSPGSERLSWRLTTVLTLVATAAVLALRALGGLEFLELAAYDQFLRMRSGHLEQPPNVAVLAIDDAELDKSGWPYPDKDLSRLIQAGLDADAAVVAIDIYRGTPVAPGSEALNKVLKETNNVVGVFKFGATDDKTVKPPAAIVSKLRTGFTDMLTDRGDAFVRRSLLYAGDGKSVATSLGAQTARIWLKGKKIVPRASPDNRRHLKLGEAVHVPLHKNFGGYRNMDAKGYQFLFDFRRTPAEVPTVKASELRAGTADAKKLEGRIVFIGVTSQSVKDYFAAPVRADAAKRQIYGVYLHALAADQLVRMALGQSGAAQSLPMPLTLFLCALIAFVSGAVIRTRNLSQEQLLGAVVLVVAVSGLSYLAFVYDWWVPVVPFLLCGLLSMILAVGFKEITERRRRAALAGLLANQVSPAIARELWDHRHMILDGGRPKPVRLTATVMFVDLEGSTSNADELPPEELVAWVSAFLEEAANAVIRYNGVIEKFTGDGLMAVFGIPVPRTTDEEIADDVRRACDCAIDIAERTDRLNERAAANNTPYTKCRVGIHTGRLSAGNVGTKQRMSYTVIGQAANLAARLEAYGKDDPLVAQTPSGEVIDCRVLLSEDSASLLNGRYNLEPLGKADLRGSRDKMKIYRLPTKPVIETLQGGSE
ncbi:MAG: adenylate/guanylate cyclase domain-containing protein [Alphaproteobacteria bacterium]|nr:adenylate/guanylate cyclase domain-containing protein [Alphaproteobacteria bacterium]